MEYLDYDQERALEECRIKELVKLDQINKFYENYSDDWRTATNGFNKIWQLLGSAEGKDFSRYEDQGLTSINEAIGASGYKIIEGEESTRLTTKYILTLNI